MSKEKESRKQKYRTSLIQADGFIISLKDRGEFGEYEDNICFATFEISGGVDLPFNIYNLNITPKDKNYNISENDVMQINKNIDEKLNKFKPSI